MSESAATTVHEAYAFACMRCGFGWEQAYEIEHHVDGSNNHFVIYRADGEQVPSPLSRPTCLNCGGNVVRIMRAGRVSTVQQALGTPRRARSAGGTADAAAGEPVAAEVAPAGGGRHRQLSGLLRPFHRA